MVNEDALALEPDAGIFVTADGPTRPTRADGTYPAVEGIIAPHIFTRTIASWLVNTTYTGHTCLQPSMALAWSEANNRIADENKLRSLDTLTDEDFMYQDCLSTVGQALWLPTAQTTPPY